MKDGIRVRATVRVKGQTQVWKYDGVLVGEADWDEWNGNVWSVKLDGGGILLRSEKDLEILEA